MNKKLLTLYQQQTIFLMQGLICVLVIRQ